MLDKYIVCRRVSGFGDMLVQLSKSIELSEHLNIPLFVDWRNVLYSDARQSSQNLFGGYVNHPAALPIEDLPCFQERFSDSDYEGFATNQMVNRLLAGKIDFDDLARNGELVITHALTMDRKEDLYKKLGEVSFSLDLIGDALDFVNKLGRFNAIHYRHGNGEFSDIKNYGTHKREIQDIKEKYFSVCHDLDKPLFVATDSLEADDIFKEVFHELRNINFSHKPLASSKGAIHYASIVDSGSKVNMFDVFKSTVTDMYILAFSEILFRDPRSSFTNYSCAVASKNSCFTEFLYDIKRRKASTLSSHEVMKRARHIITNRKEEK